MALDGFKQKVQREGGGMKATAREAGYGAVDAMRTGTSALARSAETARDVSANLRDKAAKGYEGVKSLGSKALEKIPNSLGGRRAREMYANHCAKKIGRYQQEVSDLKAHEGDPNDFSGAVKRQRTIEIRERQISKLSERRQGQAGALAKHYEGPLKKPLENKKAFEKDLVTAEESKKSLLDQQKRFIERFNALRAGGANSQALRAVELEINAKGRDLQAIEATIARTKGRLERWNTLHGATEKIMTRWQNIAKDGKFEIPPPQKREAAKIAAIVDTVAPAPTGRLNNVVDFPTAFTAAARQTERVAPVTRSDAERGLSQSFDKGKAIEALARYFQEIEEGADFESKLDAVLKNLPQKERGKQGKEKMINAWNRLAGIEPSFGKIDDKEAGDIKNKIEWKDFALALKNSKRTPAQVLEGMETIVSALQKGKKIVQFAA